MAESLAVVILAGGQSQRMGVKNKALVLFQDKPFIQHVIDQMKLQTNNIYINTHRNQDDFINYKLPMIDDEFENQEGPLVGMLTCLKKINMDWIQFVPCDTPFLPLDLINQLKKGIKIDHALVAVPKTEDGLQSTCCLCHSSTLENLILFFNHGGRKIEDWIRQLPFSIVDFKDKKKFLNFNTEAEIYKNL